MTITARDVMAQVEAVKEGRWDDLIEVIQLPETEDADYALECLIADPPTVLHGVGELNRMASAKTDEELEAARADLLGLPHTTEEAVYVTVTTLAHAVKGAQIVEFYTVLNNVIVYSLDYLPSHYGAYLMRAIGGCHSIDIDTEQCPRWDELTERLGSLMLREATQ